MDETKLVDVELLKQIEGENKGLLARIARTARSVSQRRIPQRFSISNVSEGELLAIYQTTARLKRGASPFRNIGDVSIKIVSDYLLMKGLVELDVWFTGFPRIEGFGGLLKHSRAFDVPLFERAEVRVRSEQDISSMIYVGGIAKDEGNFFLVYSNDLISNGQKRVLDRVLGMPLPLRENYRQVPLP